MLFSRNPIEKPSRLTPVGTKNSLLRLQNHLFHFFHTCPTNLLQNDITNSRFGVQRSHFGLQSGPRRARPAGRAAGPAWLARAAQPGRPVLPASRWAALQGGGEEGKAKEGGSAHQNPAPPLLSPQVGYFVYIR